MSLRTRTLAAVLVLLLTAVAVPPAPAADDVKIALVAPLSGRWARQGQLKKMGADMAIDEINSQGGIKALGGAKIVLREADAGDSVEKAVSAAQRVLTREKISAGIGSWLSSFTLGVTEVAERLQVPWLSLSYADSITERGFKYTFQTSPVSSLQAEQALDLVTDLARKNNRPIKKAGIVGDNTAASMFFYKPLRKKLLAAKRIELVVDDVWTPPLADATAIVQKLRSGQPDIVYYVPTNFPDSIQVFHKDKEFDVQAPIQGAGARPASASRWSRPPSRRARSSGTSSRGPRSPGDPRRARPVRRDRCARRRRLRADEHRPGAHLRRHARRELRPGRLHDARDVPDVFLRSLRCGRPASRRAPDHPAVLRARLDPAPRPPRPCHRWRRSAAPDGRPAHPHAWFIPRDHQRDDDDPHADTSGHPQRLRDPGLRAGAGAPASGALVRVRDGARARRRRVRLPDADRSRESAAGLRRRSRGRQLPGDRRAGDARAGVRHRHPAGGGGRGALGHVPSDRADGRREFHRADVRRGCPRRAWDD